MSAENEKINQFLNDYKNKFSKEKQRLGMEDEEKPDETSIENNNIHSFLGFGDESANNRIKLNNERKQEYMDYLSKKDDNSTKVNEYVEDVNPDTFLGFGESLKEQKHGYHKDVILAEKRQLSHDELDDERKQEYQTYLSKRHGHFSKPDEYFEKVNPDSFLGFGEEAKQPKSGYRKHVNLEESRQATIEKLQNSLQHTSISIYDGTSMYSFGQDNDNTKQKLLKERRQEYQDYLQNQKDKSSNGAVQELHKDTNPFKSPERLNAHAQNAKERHLAALAHSPFNEIEEDITQTNREYNLQSQYDEKRRQHEEYYEQLKQQIADKKQFNIQKNTRERLEDEANASLFDQLEENTTQINREENLLHDEKRRQHEEYFEQLKQQIADKKVLKVEMANRERLEDEAIDRYEHSHARF